MTAQVGPPIWSASLQMPLGTACRAGRVEQTTYRRNPHRLLVSIALSGGHLAARGPLAELRGGDSPQPEKDGPGRRGDSEVGLAPTSNSLQQIFLTSIGAMLSDSTRV